MLDFVTPHSPAAVLLSVVAISSWLLHAYWRFQDRRAPPGPTGDPIFGIARHIPKSHLHLYLTELNKQHGDLAYFRVFAVKGLTVGSYKHITNLFSRRGLVYSDRPPLPMNDIHVGVGGHSPVTKWGDKWNEERRMFVSHMGKDVVRNSYRADVIQEAREGVLRASRNSVNNSWDFFQTLLRTFIHTIYGIKIESKDDPILKAAVAGTGLASASAVPSRHLVNVLPFLTYVPDWFPGTHWKALGRMWKEQVTQMKLLPFTQMLKNQEGGTAMESFSSRMLQDPQRTLTDDQVMHTAGSCFIAGTETSSGTVMYFIWAMLMYPEVQKKAQQEVDHVVGTDRLPTHEDYANGGMPYVESIFKEILRWRPGAPWGIPHATTKDDEYEGYLIPKGTVIFQNSWAISRDPELYEDAEQFNPDRFMVSDSPLDPRSFVFNVGRRSCPGQFYAELVDVSNMITLLATMDIVKPIDKAGNVIEPSSETTGKLTNLPVPFQYVLKPRSPESLALLEAAVGAA
ncbi:cytochrome P450 [Clavulina sp. PMI_390]|nr:cytochrome P450 [Clavulina sp. PMI_390]